MTDLEAFVLIGGRSSRFGGDKALFEFEGVTLAQRAVNTITDAFPGTKISLVAREEHQFPPGQLPKNFLIIFDVYKDRGAYGGLHAALSSTESEWIFVLACDLPFVSTELLKLMAWSISEDFDAIAPVQPDGRVQPLCAFYRSGPCLKLVEKMLQAEEKLPPLRVMFEQVRTRFLRFDEIRPLTRARKFFVNVNGPVDLRDLVP